jgi:hypothetical protein
MSSLDAPDNLVAFLDLVAANQKANIARFGPEFDVLRRVNLCLSTAGKHLVNPKPVIVGLLFLRCQYAFKAATGMAMSGQAAEAAQMMRSCLEYAGYALLIFADPNRENVFLGRHVNPNGMKLQKAEFQIAEVRKVIEAFDTKLAELFKLFYDRTIDFGGHPNPHGVLSMVEMVDGENSFTALALTTDPKVLMHTMKSVAQVGLTVLYIFQHIFKEKFELLGIKHEMQKLRTENL